MTNSPPRPILAPAVRRLAGDYLPPHARRLALAGVCMIASAGGTAALAWLLDPAIRLIFLEKRADWVVALPLIVAAVADAGLPADQKEIAIIGLTVAQVALAAAR